MLHSASLGIGPAAPHSLKRGSLHLSPCAAAAAGSPSPVHKRQRIHAPPSSSDAVHAPAWAPAASCVVPPLGAALGPETAAFGAGLARRMSNEQAGASTPPASYPGAHGVSPVALPSRPTLIGAHERRIPSSPPLPGARGAEPAAAAAAAVAGAAAGQGAEVGRPWWATASERVPVADAGVCSYCCQRGATEGVSCERCDRALCDMCARGCERCAMTGCPVCCVVDFDSPVEQTLCAGCYDERVMDESEGDGEGDEDVSMAMQW